MNGLTVVVEYEVGGRPRILWERRMREMREFCRRHEKVLGVVIRILGIATFFTFLWFVETQCGGAPPGYLGP